jgi:hypothetical protein
MALLHATSTSSVIAHLPEIEHSKCDCTTSVSAVAVSVRIFGQALRKERLEDCP